MLLDEEMVDKMTSATENSVRIHAYTIHFPGIGTIVKEARRLLDYTLTGKFYRDGEKSLSALQTRKRPFSSRDTVLIHIIEPRNFFYYVRDKLHLQST